MTPERRRLPETRHSLTSKVTANGFDAYVVTSFYENRQPGEIFLHVAKEGSFVKGILDTVAIQASIMLQYGVPASVLLTKWEHMTFEHAVLLHACAQAVRSHIKQMEGNPDCGYTLPVPAQEPTSAQG